MRAPPQSPSDREDASSAPSRPQRTDDRRHDISGPPPLLRDEGRRHDRRSEPLPPRRGDDDRAPPSGDGYYRGPPRGRRPRGPDEDTKVNQRNFSLFALLNIRVYTASSIYTQV